MTRCLGIDAKVKEVYDYLNEKAEKNFKPTGTNAKYVKARLEKYSVEDLKKVVDIKVSQWKCDEKMDKYLRPQTLFSPSKFESYINEKIIKKAEKKNQFENYEEREYEDDYYEELMRIKNEKVKRKAEEYAEKCRARGVGLDGKPLR